ncbi:MAG: DUF1801 domain-containing protein [Myxococcota bacterium]
MAAPTKKTTAAAGTTKKAAAATKKTAAGATKKAAAGATEKAAAGATKKAAAGATKVATGATRRTAAKVSPLRGMPIEQWLAEKTSGWQGEVVRKLLAVVQKAAPKATVSIKWGQPVFEHHGPFAYVRPAKAHVTFGFWRGVEVADPQGLLEPGDRMSHFKVTADAALDEKALAAMVKDAVRLNELKGDPTKR